MPKELFIRVQCALPELDWVDQLLEILDSSNGKEVSITVKVESKDNGRTAALDNTSSQKQRVMHS